MRSTVNTPFGIVFREVAEPAAAPNEALVAVRAFSVNRGELALLKARTEDWRPGQDIAGVVLEPAADGSGPVAGTRVAGLVETAGWAERVAVPADRLAVLPDAVTMEQAASLPMAGLTALRTVRLGGDLLGRRVLVTGSNGGVGRFQVELAAASGAKVTAVTTSDDAAKELIALGAAEVLTQASSATGPFDVVLESVGGATLNAALAVTAPGGTVVVLGSSSGEKSPIDIYDFIGHENARLVSYLSYAHPAPAGPDLQTLVDLVAAGRLHPTLSRVTDWSRLPETLDALRDRHLPGGKAVLTLS
ncbi:zinc-binding dehydrogenase [Actinomadura harenae]|uniref:Oxidoreductase n=1 Tax=Actinomadura harenae TaxID=2483351 RepID=A0A3M2MA89_9ACTN|nr:zinc-binding dehydrogenase [Actinomadura harenae]RMI46399.1 oxidoreductase [Actinomadura harenae]